MTVTKETWEQYGFLIFCREPPSMVCELSEPHGSQYIKHVPLDIGSPDQKEVMARAKFIQAAPTMYRALRDCYDYLTRQEGEAFDLDLIIGDAADALKLADGKKGKD